MSLGVKLSVFKRTCLEEFDKKENELRRLKSDLDFTLEQARKEIISESERLDKRERSLAIEEERLNRHKERTEQELETTLMRTEHQIDAHISDVLEYFDEMKKRGKDPKIIDAYINACYALDEKLAKYFQNKAHPALGSAEIIRTYKKENLGYLQRIMNLEYQLSELWAKDADTSEKEAFESNDDDEERIRYFLSAAEYKSLPEKERNQRALDNYLRRTHSKSHIGKMYERYVGYLYESDGYAVEYRGIEMGLKDGGIDLICRKDGEILLVQCKNWRLESTIYEKHICQLYGASKYYDKDHIQQEYSDGLFSSVDWDRVRPVFVCTTNLDNHAIEVAKTLGVQVRNISFVREYPIIKCNINNGHKIYHLPIDQMYDNTRICKKGECYVSTVMEAEAMGFRRANRWRGNNG